MRIMISKTVLAATFATLATGGLALAETKGDAIPGSEDGRIEAGYLNCAYTGGSSVIVKSERKFECTYQPAEGNRPVEKYSATIASYGLDLMITDEKTMRWAVLAPATMTSSLGALEGTYGGASADAALGYGIGADILVGGLKKSVALQPVALSTGTGLGASIAYEDVRLSYEGIVPKG